MKGEPNVKIDEIDEHPAFDKESLLGSLVRLMEACSVKTKGGCEHCFVRRKCFRLYMKGVNLSEEGKLNSDKLLELTRNFERLKLKSRKKLRLLQLYHIASPSKKSINNPNKGHGQGKYHGNAEDNNK